jgi:hypothetical protein
MEGRLPFTTGMPTEEVVPLGDLKATVIRPAVVPASKVKLRPANEALEVLGTGEPPSSITVRPVVVVEAVTSVPAAIGLRRLLLASATIKVKASDALEPVYQVWPATGA